MFETLAYTAAGFVFAFLTVAALGSGADNALSKSFPWQFRLAATFRTPVLMFIVVPLSAALRLRTSVRRWWIGMFREVGGKAAKEQHEANVEKIASQLRGWNSDGRQRKLRTARPNWAAMSLKLGSNKDDCHLIATSELKQIIAIDVENLTITAEPGVTMGELTDVLLPLGLALQTHVEMESITLGGIAMGFGIETNSFRYGFFQESVLEYSFLDSMAKQHTVTADSAPEVFYALPWSHGTLGFLTRLVVRLVRTKPFVRMVYEPTKSAAQLTERLTALAALPEGKAPDFLEATLYDKERAVIQAGYYVSKAELPPSTPIVPINAFYRPFFFRHVETFLDGPTCEEVVPLKHFLHRFTRSIFWELEDMIPFANHPLYRCLWGWLGAPEVALLKLFQGPVIRRASVYAHVVQESIMPMRRLPEGIDKFDEWFGAYPLLVFPVRIFNRGKLSGLLTPRAEECDAANGRESGLWVDLGAYGVPRNVKAGLDWDAKGSIREMEHWTRDVGGFQALYTDIACTPSELRQMFNFTLLDDARKALKANDAFPEVYDKVKSEAGIWDLSAEMAAEAKLNGGH